ncbi:UPF0058 family protein [Methanimicrococcus blatticola]|uniref:Metal-binding protein n=1 Tax=Methanimicrococcus blatticola TaxID=91560 RepID=A0A484F576_9EURY|nr:UPF0058 family protein [Methanimicrococcus blatticola]MBZ3935686.1 UPF0058 family protein [Methanimicrococcus blatticola]MCC2508193.1 UPF0058 family protein [Methanimicrococcus blatticola]TDQ68729.1 hypothetical protein C7391_0920 [Methanimicrococcus blatticola]
MQVGGDSIQKQDLIRVHADLVKMKNNYEKMGYQKEFDDYYDLYITPMHVHKSKDEHERAIFMLSSKLSSIVAEENALYQTAKIKTHSDDKIELRLSLAEESGEGIFKNKTFGRYEK